MINREKEPSFFVEIFSPKYIKRDFGTFLQDRESDRFIFWMFIGMISLNFLGAAAVFGTYIVQAILHML